MPRLEGHVLTPAGFVRGTLHHDAGRITAVDGVPVDESAVRDADRIVLPGFVDLHVHGGGGHDAMDGGDAVVHLARTHARHGTTALLATTMTAPRAEIESALAALAPWARGRREPGMARVLGVHLEGPFISPARLGAQPGFAVTGTLEDLLALHAIAPIALVTIAPERPAHLALIVELRRAGFLVQIGHSDGTYEDGVAALGAGASGFTHLFDAMSGLHHRAPGMVGAALAHAERAEIIPDLLHVHPGAIRLALRCIPGLYCVTDGTAATGMPDGRYRLGRQRVDKCLGAVRLADGTLAGSTLTMDLALRNLVGLGLGLAEASRRTSTLAADHVGRADLGRLASGARADAVVLDRDLAVREVWIEGQPLGF